MPYIIVITFERQTSYILSSDLTNHRKIAQNLQWHIWFVIDRQVLLHRFIYSRTNINQYSGYERYRHFIPPMKIPTLKTSFPNTKKALTKRYIVLQFNHCVEQMLRDVAILSWSRPRPRATRTRQLPLLPVHKTYFSQNSGLQFLWNLFPLGRVCF